MKTEKRQDYKEIQKYISLEVAIAGISPVLLFRKRCWSSLVKNIHILEKDSIPRWRYLDGAVMKIKDLLCVVQKCMKCTYEWLLGLLSNSITRNPIISRTRSSHMN